MDLSVYFPEQLEEARSVLSKIDAAPAVLADLDKNLCDEIEYYATKKMSERVGLIQQSLTTLNQYTSNPDINEQQLYDGWRGVRMAINAMRPVSQIPKLQ